MAPKTIKLGKKDDIASVVKQIKNLKDREVLFELSKGSLLLKSSDSLRLMKRTGDALGKKIQVVTDDEVGRILAKKAGVLAGEQEVHMPKGLPKVARSDVKPRFSDIFGSRRPKVLPAKAIREKAVEPVEEPIHSFSPRVPRDWSLNNNFSKYFILGLVLVVMAFFALAIMLPRADITVAARSEPVSRDFEITVDKNATAVDSSNLVIPGIPVSKEVSQTKSFETTGTATAGNKAAGSVQLYNFTTSTLKLKASTTTLVAGGKKYFFTKDVTDIKPTTSVSTPSTPPVGIVAEQAGENYNLPANTKFQIVNTALGSRNVYATSSTAVSGGATTASAGVLSQADLDKATQTLTNDILTQAESDLSQEKGETIILLPSGLNKEILAHTANKNVGDKVDSFNMTLIAKVTGLGFAEDDLTGLMIQKIQEVLSSDKYLLPDAKKQYNAAFKSLDLAGGKGVLSVHFETMAAYKVDNSNLTKILAGKTEGEIREILLSKPEVDSVKVEFWPHWMVHKAPKFNGKVYIKTVLSQSE